MNWTYAFGVEGAKFKHSQYSVYRAKSSSWKPAKAASEGRSRGSLMIDASIGRHSASDWEFPILSGNSAISWGVAKKSHHGCATPGCSWTGQLPYLTEEVELGQLNGSDAS